MIIVDVGTHNGDEIRLLAGTNLRSRTERLRLAFLLMRSSGPISSQRTLLELESLQRDLTSPDDRYVMIEPLPWRRFMRQLHLLGTFIYFQGATSAQGNREVQLHISKTHLGHSLFAEKPGLSGEKLPVWNFNFPDLWQSLDRLGLLRDSFRVLRINAEGVEAELISPLLRDDDLRPHVVMGSLGDVKKVFGQEKFEALKSELEFYGVPFIYFTSLPNSWLPAITALRDIHQQWHQNHASTSGGTTGP